MRPRFGFLGQRAEVPLTAPVAARAADPAVQHLAVFEAHRVSQPRDEIGQLRLGLALAQLVNDLVRDGHDEPGIIGQRCLRHQNQGLAVAQARDDLLRGLLARELAEVFLDVLDLERAGVERVLLDQVLQTVSTGYPLDSIIAPRIAP